MPPIRFFLAVATLCALLVAFAARAEVAGRYVGLGAAQGATLALDPRGAEAFDGVIDLGEGPVAFRAEKVGETAEADLTIGETRVFLRVVEAAAGVVATLAPIDAEGRLRADRTSAYAFIPEGTPLPDFPARFLPEPSRPPRVLDAEAFVASYPFWSPQGAAWGYEAVAPRYRTVIRLFPEVQTDLLRKICRSPERTAGIAEALRGQGVTCRDVLGALPEGGAATRRFADAVEAERALLMRALDCATDLTRTNPDCAAAGRETARRAASTDTVATVLRRYR